VTCMELIEHVPSPAVLMRALRQLLRPGGQLFISTINRNLRSFLTAIVGAEYLLNLIPRGTHEYAKLLRPSEIAALARAEQLHLRDVSGIEYNPLLRTARLTRSPQVNYLAHFQNDAEARS
jgi:2-polyprenyl-6-hydroxyphenyl methylase/3-demethylubiquinone-9 3-methyltransferase